ncbi:MAG: hypothetical protein ACO222_01770 [Polynucleobacter sp.]
MSLIKVSYSMIEGAQVNALDFGADPTGVADSTAAIQNAWDSFTYGMLFLPAGIYKTTDTLDFSVASTTPRKGVAADNAIIRPYVTDKQGVKIGANANQRFFVLRGPLTIDMTNSTGVSCVGFENSGEAWQADISDLTVASSPGVGVKILEGAYLCNWTNLTTWFNTGIGLSLEGTNLSLAVTTNQFNSLASSNNGSYGIYAKSVVGCMFNNPTIESNNTTNAQIYLEEFQYNSFNAGFIESSGIGYQIGASVLANHLDTHVNCPTEYAQDPGMGIFLRDTRYPVIPFQYGRPISFDVDEVQTLGSISGFLYLVSSAVPTAAQFCLLPGSSAIVYQSGSDFSTTAGTGSKVNVYWDAGSSTHKIQNKLGYTVTLKQQFFMY